MNPEDTLAIAEELLPEQPGAEQGMRALLARLRRAKGGSWDALADIDWAADVAPLRRWFPRVIDAWPPTDAVNGLLFMVPEIEGSATPRLDWCGWRGKLTKSWECDPVWPDYQAVENDKRPGLPKSTLPLKTLKAARQALGFKRAYDEALCDREQLALYVVPVACVAFTVQEALADLDRARFPAPSGPVPVLCGYNGGDYLRAGSYTARGWKP